MRRKAGKPIIFIHNHMYLPIIYYLGVSRLLRFVTASEHLPPAGFSSGSISVNFSDGDAVIGATCQLKLTLPTNINKYSDFKQSLLAVLPDGKEVILNDLDTLQLHTIYIIMYTVKFNCLCTTLLHDTRIMMDINVHWFMTVINAYNYVLALQQITAYA